MRALAHHGLEVEQSKVPAVALAVLLARIGDGTISGKLAKDVFEGMWAEERGAEADDWESVKIGAGRLFLVGDAKQSIYRFRRADIEMYGRAKERIRACGGRVESITVNFRSAPRVIDWVNARFGRILVREGTWQPEYEPLVAGPTAADDGPGVIVLVDGSQPAPASAHRPAMRTGQRPKEEGLRPPATSACLRVIG